MRQSTVYYRIYTKVQYLQKWNSDYYKDVEIAQITHYLKIIPLLVAFSDGTVGEYACQPQLR